MKFNARPTNFAYGNYPDTASNPIRAYRPNGRQRRCRAGRDFLTFCVLEETVGTTADDLDKDDVDMDRSSQRGPEPTTLEAVGDQWRYALVVVQAGDDDVLANLPSVL